MGKIVILIGNYGSGKTEIAMNLAVSAAEEGLKTQVIDLDKVNDYFRLSDRVKLLEEKKVDVVSPTYAGRGVTPVNMSAAVASAFAGDWDLVVFDVGGDAAGAMSLGRYHQDFASLAPGRLEVYDIVNVFRPMSESPPAGDQAQGGDGELCPPAGDGLREQFQSSHHGVGGRSAPGLRSHPPDLGHDRHTGSPDNRERGVPAGIYGGRQG